MIPSGFRFLPHPQNPRQVTLLSDRLYCVLATTSTKKDEIFRFERHFEDLSISFITIQLQNILLF
jgi:hypothetical protein